MNTSSSSDHESSTHDESLLHYTPPTERKPGELGFAIFLAIASLVLLYHGYKISGFEALSAPGVIPMATSFVMAVTSLVVLYKTIKIKRGEGEQFFTHVLPVRIIFIIIMLMAYAFALKPVGFLPTSAVFLIVTIKYLGKRSWASSALIGLGGLLVIYLIFRIVFTVLMPAGVVAEAEILAWIRNLFAGRG